MRRETLYRRPPFLLSLTSLILKRFMGPYASPGLGIPFWPDFLWSPATASPSLNPLLNPPPSNWYESYGQSICNHASIATSSICAPSVQFTTAANAVLSRDHGKCEAQLNISFTAISFRQLHKTTFGFLLLKLLSKWFARHHLQIPLWKIFLRASQDWICFFCLISLFLEKSNRFRLPLFLS